MEMFKALAISVVVGAACSSAAWAGPVSSEYGSNLVSNGGFENSTTVAASGWTVSGAYQLEGFDYLIDASPADAESGSNSFAGGAIGDLGFLSQNIITKAGTAYNIHLAVANFSGFADGTALEVVWGGNVVYSATNILGSGYVDILVDPLATGGLTTLSIGIEDDSFFLNLDDVSVRAVPEPEVFALLAGGLGIGALLRRRRRPA